ncbi:deoxyribose-phosphate aldolase [Siphonobacter sp. BAB-5385]|uniref:deoxyribose-phosphate aldolase n=1 Tax=Siphonobacter sp. BAB-5385 TaxID=1864822 RepID=UPI000B9E5668|nr:deoxyribose-phosphate aldolase [Siphonobacter sp. BAB-5385]OZI10134.1 deoxyribose-phosphate aldolase [Siphonobacter sp. BAB-5385]
MSVLSKLIDHALLHPTLTDAELEAGCRLAIQYDVATVCIKPYAVSKAAQWLAGSRVGVCTVIGFPHGSNTMAVKVAETIQACRDGATEIDMVVNIGKVLSEDWTYVRQEIQAVQEACQQQEALLKVIFENDFLPADAYKIKLCEICTEIGVAFVKTSTGFGYVKQPDGSFQSQGATLADLQLMLDHIGPNVAVKASGGIRTLEQVRHLQAMGVQRIGTSSTSSILNEGMME